MSPADSDIRSRYGPEGLHNVHSQVRSGIYNPFVQRAVPHLCDEESGVQLLLRNELRRCSQAHELCNRVIGPWTDPA